MNLIESTATWLRGKESDTYSQFGEDGIIAAIHGRIGESNRWCFEVGAADGEFYSNTRRLRESDWDVVLIESNDEHFAKLARLQSSQVRCVHETIGPDSLDRILKEVGCPYNPDLGVIDIDGQDWWIFEGLRLFRPRVLMVEFANGDPTAGVPARGTPGQAGYDAIHSLGLSKGYKPIVSTQVNLIFVAGEAWE